MRIRYHDVGHLTRTGQAMIDRALRRLDDRLVDFADDLKSLDLTLDYYTRAKTFDAKLVLSLAGQRLAVVGKSARRETAIREGFDELLESVDAYLARLRGEPVIRREGKFHREKASLMAEVAAAASPVPEPPRSAGEAARWGLEKTDADS